MPKRTPKPRKQKATGRITMVVGSLTVNGETVVKGLRHETRLNADGTVDQSTTVEGGTLADVLGKLFGSK